MNPLTLDAPLGDPAPAAGDFANLHARIARSVATARDEFALLAELVELLGSITNAAAVLSWSGEVDAPLRRGPCQISRQILEWVPDFDQRIAGEAHLAAQEQRLRVTRLDLQRPLVACSLPAGPGAVRCLQLVLMLGSQPLEPFLVILQLLGGYLALRGPLTLGQRDAEHLALAAAQLELVEALVASAAGTAARLLCESLQRHGEARSVVLVAMDTSGRCRYKAAAGLGQDAERGPVARAAERAASELAEAGTGALYWTEGALENSGAAAFARGLDARHALLAPLRIEAAANDSSGYVICVSWRTPPARLEEFHRLLDSGGPLLAACLAANEGSTPGSLAKALQWLQRHRVRRHVVAGAITGLLLLLACPVPHRVAADITLVPAQYRYVSAPFDGILATTHHKIGELVRSGEVLAEMDSHEIANELATIEAEIAKAAKQRDVALAHGDSAAGQLAGFDYQRYLIRRELILKHQQDLSIKSPIEGVIIAGDLEKARGAAVQTGQVLFEIAPLHELELEAAIADEDIRWISAGQSLSYDLDAFRGTGLTATLDHVQPRAEIREARNVFVAVARLANAGASFRPGMSGVGHVRVGLRPLCWVLLHKPLAFVSRYLTW